MTETMRIRVVFEEDRRILSKAQRSEGLNRSWLLLNPQHLRTISDVSSHLLHIFNLHHSCPNGLLLYMEGFVLPPFESTCILKDKEVICVKKKGDKLCDVLKVGEAMELLEEGEVVEKQPVHSGLPLLANEEFEKETGGYQSESEDDDKGQSEGALPSEDSSDDNVVSKKRKACTKLQTPKKKKHRVTVPNGTEDVHTEKTENHHDDEPLSKKSKCEEKQSDVKSKAITSSSPGTAEKSAKKVESSSKLSRSEQLQENGQKLEDASPVPEGAKKVPSRRARRKKAKRQWLREVAKIAKKKPQWMTESAKDDEDLVGGHQKRQRQWKTELAKADQNEVGGHSKGKRMWKTESAKSNKNEQKWKAPSEKADNNGVAGPPKGLLHWKQLPDKHVHKDITKQNESNQDRGLDTSIVPIVVRPGHIRFEPLENDQAGPQGEVSTEDLQWNGITSKKKGQKWGTEKSSFVRRSDSDDLKKENSQQVIAEKEVSVTDPHDFDKLPPLCELPKEGDVIAYRLIELSSSWTPEMSSFRVGKVSSYIHESSKITLMPVPDYPVVSEKDEDTLDNMLYGEDGSLETDFSSLIDPRIVKQRNSNPANAVSTGVNQTAYKEATSCGVASSNENKAHDFTPVKEVNLWDQLSETLNAKKTELAEENEWAEANSGRNPWSYRALRGSALGPTMAMLRSKNKI